MSTSDRNTRAATSRANSRAILALTLVSPLVVTAMAPGEAYAYAIGTSGEAARPANKEPQGVQIAWVWALGTAARGALVGTAVRTTAAGGAGLMMTRSAAATGRFARPYGTAPHYNYRPNYYQPSFQPAVHVHLSRPTIGDGYGSNYAYGNVRYQHVSQGNTYQPVQRECWTTGIELIPVYGGQITRRHYRCAYR